MNLQTKLIAGFAIVTGITLVVSALGFWQTRKLSAALYEVGVVRLPSSQALDAIFEAKTALDASKRELMRASTLLRIAAEMSLSAGNPARTTPPPPPKPATGDNAPEVRMTWGEVLAEELRRQERSWARAEKGWREYATLPKTPAEAEKWQACLAAWRAWQASYEKIMGLLVRARDTGDIAHLHAAHEENQERLFTLARDSRNLLNELAELNERIAHEVKETSIASRHDAEVMQRLMLAAVVLSVAAALGGGFLLNRMISRSLRPMAAAFTQIAGGDLRIRVPVTTRDEIGNMAAAMNNMVESLRATEAARKKATEAQAETADRLELALRTSRLGVWRRNVVTEASEWDARMFELFGLPPAPAAPNRLAILAMIAPEDRAAAAAYWSQTPQHGSTYQYRLTIIRADGQRRHLETHGRVQEVAGQPPEWILGVVGDITDIVEASAESARLRERLAQAKKMEALGTQATSVAHDFNNLLTSIKGFIDLAAFSLPGQHESATLLHSAQAGALSARALVQRLLHHARNPGEAPRESLDIARLVREALALAAAGFPRRITHQLEAAPDLPAIRGDASSLQRVLINLCTNAAHAIGGNPGHIRLTVEMHELAAGLTGNPGCPAGRYVRLSVSDDGCGMNASVLQHIFEPYFTTKSAGDGTGLGLSIVSDIIAEHRGGLTVESQPGTGTTFRIYLPVAITAPIAPSPSARTTVVI